jgi:transcriptional regulator GlxA family with amidase domain
MDKVKDLLRTTDLKVCEISAATGFTRPNHLFRVFRRSTAMSPNAYRARQKADSGQSLRPQPKNPGDR